LVLAASVMDSREEAILPSSTIKASAPVDRIRASAEAERDVAAT
jgi:hypothetical protein